MTAKDTGPRFRQIHIYADGIFLLYETNISYQGMNSTLYTATSFLGFLAFFI
jgi:hypothetical protein